MLGKESDFLLDSFELLLALVTLLFGFVVFLFDLALSKLYKYDVIKNTYTLPVLMAESNTSDLFISYVYRVLTKVNKLNFAY